MKANYKLAFKNKEPSSRGKEVVLVSWDKPQRGWVKLNTSGSSLENPSRLRAGGIF